MSTDAFHLFLLQANCITHRVATVRDHPPFQPETNGSKAPPILERPLVILLHGWPEGWYCWRHQLVALANAGYAVCAPDMRGYGGTDQPLNVKDYSMQTLCQDVLQIAQTLGYSKIVLVGHDMGAFLAWNMALLHPKTVVAVCGMSVPYLGHTPRDEPFTARLQRHFGTCLPHSPYFASRQEQEEAKFNYILQHNLPHIEHEYDRNAEEALYRIYSFRSGVACYPDTPEVKDLRMFPPSHCRAQNSNELLDARSAPGWWSRLPRPKALPPWMPRADFEYFLEQYKRSGFAGGLKWYQVLDSNWFLKGKKVQQPSLFLCGGDDRLVLNNHGGADHVIQEIRQHCANLKETVMIEGAGHWIQQECPNQVNRHLLDFLSSAVPVTTTVSRL